MREQKGKHINLLTDFGYEPNLKYYRDVKNVVDTSKKEGNKEGRIEVARAMKQEGYSNEQINKLTGLTDDEINDLQRKTSIKPSAKW